MKLFLFFAAFIASGFAPSLRAADATDAEYAALLKKYVSPEGVRYRAWKQNAADLAALDRVVNGIAQSKRSDLAFYLNAYNAWILHEALEKYPTKSVKDALFTFFLTDRIVVGGERMSFNKLEKDVIRARFKEPRIHFALNCASRSCPPLASDPFTARRLDTQLDGLARGFVNSDRGVTQTGSTLELSKIFDWYNEDFGGPKGTLAFINKHRATPLPSGAKVVYQNYNWNLNEAK
jgi:hypothetical protein